MLREGQKHDDAQRPVALSDLAGDQRLADAHTASVPGDLAPANRATTPNSPSRAQTFVTAELPTTTICNPRSRSSAVSHRSPDAHTASADGTPHATDHSRTDDQRRLVGGSPLAPRRTTNDDQFGVAGGDHRGVNGHGCPDGQGSNANGSTPVHDALLLILADALDDLERVRIATENRVRSLSQVKGMEGSPEQQKMEQLAASIAALEHQATLDLKRAMRAHPLGAWVKRTVGVGEKQAARLLAAIGDPATRENPAKLWAYCGFHVIDGKRPRRRRGERANWSNTAKMRARLIAESCIKQSHSPYRAAYDRERAKWADRDTTDLHKHNHALAVVAKAVLLDIWKEARVV